MKTFNVAFDDLSALMAGLPAAARDPLSGIAFSPDPEDQTKGELRVPDEHTDAVAAGLKASGLKAGRRKLLTDYLGSLRYEREIAGITTKVGGESVPVSTAREDRDGLRDTLLAISAQLRKDGAAFKFADGVSRPASNAEMQAAISSAFAHVQAAYDSEGAVQAQIASDTLKTAEAVASAFAAA